MTNLVKHAIRRSLQGFGYGVYRLSDEERQFLRNHERQRSHQSLETVFGAELARLRELRTRYAQVRLPIANHSVWGTKGRSETHLEIGWGGVDLGAFRSHGAYVWSYGGFDPLTAKLRYYIFAAHARKKDTMQLLQTLHEDGAFGCPSFSYPGIGMVSRDLLDSVIELNFLHKHLNLLARDDLRVLDIGAGYGRLAHRMLEANPNIKSYTCVDAVPESTFLCEFYLKHRGLRDRAEVVPMDELEHRLGSYDLALNIHSFSECTYAAVEWWLTQIEQRQVRYLMIVPNNPKRFVSVEVDGRRRDFGPLLRELGYDLIAQEPVFDDPAVREFMGVSVNMFLFERRNSSS